MCVQCPSYLMQEQCISNRESIVSISSVDDVAGVGAGVAIRSTYWPEPETRSKRCIYQSGVNSMKPILLLPDCWMLHLLERILAAIMTALASDFHALSFPGIVPRWKTGPKVEKAPLRRSS
jgi:hypothetical protein